MLLSNGNATNCVKNKTINTISTLLTDICVESTKDKDTNIKHNIKPFLSKRIPSISIVNYLSRLVKYTDIENSTLEMMLILIDRFCEKTKIILNYFNIHKIILSSLIISIKVNEDQYYDNHFYSKVGGVSIREINILEYEFLSKIEFDVFINEIVYLKYHNYLMKTYEKYEKVIQKECCNNKDVFSENEDNNTTEGEIEQWEK